VARVINCECGFVAQAETDGEVIALIREHMRTDHPDLFDRVSADDLVDWIQEG
jgi:predicted small metal-binding protein